MADEAIAQAFSQIPLRLAVEDFLPNMLRRDLPKNVMVFSRQPEDVRFPFVLVTGVGSYDYSPMRDGMDVLACEVHVFTEGVDAEVDGVRLAWLVWHLLDRYAKDNAPTSDERRSFVRLAKLLDKPRRRPDWAEAVGPVQYQDLPQGVERHKFHARLVVHHMW